MSPALQTLLQALEHGTRERPQVGGFPYLAETLRKAGALWNTWHLPACQSLFLTTQGPVVLQGTPLLQGPADVPAFDQQALIQALRADQAGLTSFPEFLAACWAAGVVHYRVDFEARTVTYDGCQGESYVEAYPAVEVPRSEAAIEDRGVRPQPA